MASVVHIQNLTRSPISLKLPLIPGVSRAVNLPPYVITQIDRDVAFQALGTLTEYLNAGVIYFDPDEITGGSGGSQGATGLAGAPGAQGVTGLRGLTGLAGLQGSTGIAGAQGATGISGSAGATGMGIQGVTGAGTQGGTGIAGVQGVTGLLGLTGLNGIQGSTGLSGAQGVTGLLGLTGLNGIQGSTGLSGAQGATGISGSAGATGMGIQGVTGAGTQGDTGLGASGPQGTTGIQGATGASGAGSGDQTVWLSFDSGNVVVKASGTSANLASVTATKDFSVGSRSRLILNQPTGVVYHTAYVTFTAAETTGRTEIAIEFPEPNGQTTMVTSVRPLLIRYNLVSNGIGSTASTATNVAGTVVAVATSYTAATDQKLGIVF